MLNFSLFKDTIKNTFVINGKSNRLEFWNYQAWMTIISIIGGLISAFVIHDILILFIPFLIFNLISSTTLGIRRLNDLNLNKWLILTSFIPLIGPIIYFGFIGLTPGENKKELIDLNFFKRKDNEKEMNS
jgi:uncharacterized membrane protein YhaH (DUF805 family)